MAELPSHNPDRPASSTEPNESHTVTGSDDKGEYEFPKRADPEQINTSLNAYKSEAESARSSGLNARDTIWRNNVDRYWGRYDMSKKADWQSKLVMPHAAQNVDRWASAMRDAMESQPRAFAVELPAGSPLEPLVPHIEKTMDVLLSRCSRTPDGHFASFASLFEDQMKLGALKALCTSVTWEAEGEGGRVVVASVDPHEVWYDPKGRNLYRRRRYEIDKHELVTMASSLDEFGLPLYDMEQVAGLGAEVDETMRAEHERLSGGDEGTAQGRTPIIIDEWRATIILEDGMVAADNSLIIQANEKYIIRGPEQNPYWHKQDWIVFSPMISVPMSIYGRTYMEEWAPTVDAFIEMTNLILDATYTSATNAYVAQPDYLADPTQLAEGVHPNVVFQLDDGIAVADFMKEIPLGNLPPEAVAVWGKLKEELQEGAKLSEMALGQIPNKTHISATATAGAQQSSSAMIRSIAKTIEQRWFEPVLTLVWNTALQYMDFMTIADQIGEETAQMLNAQRQAFRDHKISFRVRGISGLLDRQMKLQAFLQFVQVISQNQQLLMVFMQKTNFQKLLQTVMVWLGLDPTQFEYTQQEQLQMQLQQLIGGQQGAAPQQGQQQAPQRAQLQGTPQ